MKILPQKKIPMTDQLKDKAAKMLKFDEGVRFKPYLCPAGKKTIGVGHNIEANPLPPNLKNELEQTGVLSFQSVECLLEKDIDEAIAGAKDIFGKLWNSFSEARQLAILNMIYAMGTYGLLKWNNTIKHIRAGEWAAASECVLDSKWAKVQAPGRARRVATLMKLADDLKAPLSFDFSILSVYI